jgi:hydroxypyruvate reductase
LKAVDPAAAVHNYFKAHPDIEDQIQSTPGRVFVVGAGKAGAPMAAAISERFRNKISDGLVIVKYDHLGNYAPEGITLKEAGHPVPDEAGLQAAQEIAAMLDQAGPDDTVLCLISGGGSALLTLPVEGLTLADLQDTTNSLLAAGSIINEINTIRKHLSAIKGGGLAKMAAPARV